MTRFAVRLAAFAAAFALLPFGSVRAADPIRLALPLSMDVTPALYADKAGLFKKAGLDVQITQLNSGAAIAAAVAGGAQQIGFSSLPALISGHVRGVSFQLIAPGGVYDDADPYAYFLVRKDGTIKSGKDLNGKTLGSTSLKDLNWVAASAWIDQHGGDSKTVKFIELPNPALTPALAEGRIDGFSVGEPWNLFAVQSGKARSIGKPFSAIANHFIMTGYFVTKDWADKNRDTLQKIERVLVEASAYVNAHPAENNALQAAWTKIPADILAKAAKGTDTPYLDAKLVQPMIDISAKYGVISKPFPADELISPYALKAPR